MFQIISVPSRSEAQLYAELGWNATRNIIKIHIAVNEQTKAMF